MIKFFAKVDAQGRVTIPKSLRTNRGIKEGDTVLLTYEGKELKE